MKNQILGDNNERKIRITMDEIETKCDFKLKDEPLNKRFREKN